jgi:hypothetical protein
MDSSHRKALVEAFIEAYNSFDIEGMIALLHPQCRFWNVSDNEVNASADGPTQFRELAEQSAQMFSAREQRITGFRDEGETISVDIDYEGVLAVDVPDGPRAGDLVQLQGQSIYELRDGLIYRLTDHS